MCLHICALVVVLIWLFVVFEVTVNVAVVIWVVDLSLITSF